jgi:hypothetical protein
MYRKGSSLPGVEISNRYGRYPWRMRVGTIIEALTGIMDDDRIFWRLEYIFQLPLGSLPFPVKIGLTAQGKFSRVNI